VNTYYAPLEDIRFALRELSDIDRVSQLPDGEALADTELTDAILDQAARFAHEVLAPLDEGADSIGASWSEQGVTTAPGFKEAYRQFVDAGWNNIGMSPEYGGQGLPILLCAVVNEMFVSSNQSFCYCPELTASAVKALTAGGSPELKQTYIPKLVSGQWAATMNLTEPQAGSEVGALRTRAEPQPDGTYRLFGQKIFISYGEHDLTENIVHMVLARIPGAPEGTKGVSLFLVPKFLPDGTRNDVRCTGIEHKLGNNGSPTCTLVYGDGGEGAVGWLVGTENRGLNNMFLMVNPSRFNVGQEGLACSSRAYQQALSYARERIQGRLPTGGGSVPIIRHPDVRRLLQTMRSQTEAMRGVSYHLASARDLAARHPDPEVRQERQAFVDLMIPVYKGWASETGIEVASMSIQVHGGMGYILESGVSQPLRDVRISAIYEGTTAIQAHDLVERKLVRDGGAALRAWQAQIHQTLAQLNESNDADLREIGTRLRRAVEAMKEGSDWALANFGQRPLEVLAGSVPLLRLFGLVAGGWQMGRAALAAQRLLAQGRGHEPFLRAKVASARFYAAHLLPQAHGLAEIATGGGEAAMALDDAAF